MISTDLKLNPYGFQEPKVHIPIDKRSVEVFIVPGVVFDMSGHRIGYGQGWYDALLKGTDAIKIGLCFQSQIIDKVPAEEHDIPMDYIITERGVFRC